MYWHEGSHQFTADHVIDLDESETDFENSHGPEDSRCQTGPVDASSLKGEN